MFMLLNKYYFPLQILVFWPIWWWYIQRMLDGSDEPWGVLALLTASIILYFQGRWRPLSQHTLLLCMLFIALYTISFAVSPPLFRGVIAITVLAIALSNAAFAEKLQPGLMGLLLLSLPLIASLQFYGGFPIRVVTAYVSSHFLSLLGYAVDPQGTLLHWRGEIIAVDAPCAGIKMLWSGLFMNFTLATWRNLGFFSTWLSTSVTLCSVFIGNLIRATLLFFTESGIVFAPDFAHEAIGLLVFGMIAMAVITFHQQHGQRSLCVA